MTDWYRLELGDSAAAYGPTGKIQDAWHAAFSSKLDVAGFDFGNAIFCREEGSAHVVYFTPGAAQIAEAFKATPGEKPDSREIVLLAGDDRAWGINFPDRVANRLRNAPIDSED